MPRGASCQNTSSGYRCHCQSGLHGRNCGTGRADDCRPSGWPAPPASETSRPMGARPGAGQGTCQGHVRGWAGQYPGAGLAPAALPDPAGPFRRAPGWGLEEVLGGARWPLATSEVVAGSSGGCGARLMGPQLVHPSISQPDSRTLPKPQLPHPAWLLT